MDIKFGSPVKLHGNINGDGFARGLAAMSCVGCLGYGLKQCCAPEGHRNKGGIWACVIGTVASGAMFYFLDNRERNKQVCGTTPVPSSKQMPLDPESAALEQDKQVKREVSEKLGLHQANEPVEGPLAGGTAYEDAY